MIGGGEEQAWQSLHDWINDLWHLEDPIQEIRDLRWDRDRLAAAIFAHILEDRGRFQSAFFNYGSSPSRWHPRQHDWRLWLTLKNYTPQFLSQVATRQARVPLSLMQGYEQRNGQ